MSEPEQIASFRDDHRLAPLRKVLAIGILTLLRPIRYSWPTAANQVETEIPRRRVK